VARSNPTVTWMFCHSARECGVGSTVTGELTDSLSGRDAACFQKYRYLLDGLGKQGKEDSASKHRESQRRDHEVGLDFVTVVFLIIIYY